MDFEALIQKIKILEERLSALEMNEGCLSLSIGRCSAGKLRIYLSLGIGVPIS